MDRYNGDQIRERSRGSRERDTAESTFGRLNPDSGDRGDHYGRGRGRSPVLRRRRSRSPPTSSIDRYVPGGSPRPRRSRSPQRPRYEGYSHPPPTTNMSRIDRYVPGGSASAPVPPLLDPRKLDYSVTYSYFSEWYNQVNGKEKETISKDEVQSHYDSYKDDLNARLARLFVAAHKGDEWFKERYMPGQKEATKAKIIEYRRELWHKWKGLLDLGAFDAVDRETKLPNAKPESNGDNNSDLVEEVNRGVDDGGLKPVLLIKTISPTVSRLQLEELARSNIDNFHFVSLSDPNPLKKFHRIGFILTKNGSGEDKETSSIVDESTVELLNGKSIHDSIHGDFVCHVGIHNGPTNPRARKLLNEYMSMPENLQKEGRLVEQCIKKLEAELRDHSVMEEFDGWEMIKDKVYTWGMGEREKREGSEEEGEEGADAEVELKILKKKIDIGVEYLRRAFNFCLYCVSSSDSIHELTRKCPGGHIRRPTPSPDYCADTRTVNWTKNWQDKLELFVNPPDPNSEDYAERLKKIGGTPVAEALQEEMMKFVKQEDEGKYRCKVQNCPKLFKAEEFWKKHLEKKHAEWLQQLEADAILVNSYVSDPTRVHPPKIEQNAQGNFQAGGMGGPRNATMLPLSLMTGGASGGFHPPPGFPFNPAFMQAAASGAAPNGHSIIGSSGVGPVRRRDNRNQPGGINGRRDRYGQPYTQRDRADREKERERRDREMKEAQSKRGSSGSAAGGEAELAVMGRAVKSYKDLDATEGKRGVDELDY